MSHLYQDGTVILDPEKLMEDAKIHAWSKRGLIHVYNLDFEDIVSELVLAAYQAAPRYDPEKASVNTYISRIMVYRLLQLQAVSYKARHVLLGGPHELTEPCEQRWDPDQILGIKEVMALLPEELHQFALLLMEYGTREILAIPGMNRRRYYKNIQRLREVFRRHGVNPVWSPEHSLTFKR